MLQIRMIYVFGPAAVHGIWMICRRRQDHSARGSLSIGAAQKLSQDLWILGCRLLPANPLIGSLILIYVTLRSIFSFSSAFGR